MTAPSTIHPALWFLCAVALVFPLCAQAQNRPITIPPATQITPPTAPPTTPTPASPAPQGVTPAPRTVLPTSIEIARDPMGAGIVMYGQLAAKADSAVAVISAVFAYSGAFDPIPTPLLAVIDKSDRSAQTLFAATVRGATILGIAVVALDDTGGSVSVFYDYADSFPGSFPRLLQALGPGGADTGLTSLHLADGSQISVAPGWRVLGQGKAIVDLGGGQGELMSLGNKIPVYSRPTVLAGSVAQAQCCDPVAAFQAAFPQFATAAQRRGWPSQILTDITDSAVITTENGSEGALILATASVGGRAYSYLALAEALSGFTDPWTLRLSSITAPQPVFAAELPSLLSMWSSYSANPQGLGERLRTAAQSIDALQPILKPSPDATQYRADGGWNDVINTVVTHPGATGSSLVDEATARNLVARLAKGSGSPWHIAPWPSH
jgi:hypothetical protein